MSAKKLPPIRLSIKGLEWGFHLQNDRAYKKTHGDDSAGIIYPDDKEVYFNKSHLSLNYVIHELLHVYYASCLTNSSNLEPDQVEDNCAEILGEHYFEIGMNAQKIIDYFLNSH
jgi:hypothetical protein